MKLNARAAKLCDRLILDSESLGIAVTKSPCGSRLIDCGIDAPGSREAGRRLAEICLADLAHVEFVPTQNVFGVDASVAVSVDEPVAACMASQYAGWQIIVGKYFAMGSGPMRAAAGKEALFDAIGFREQPEFAVGVLETRKMPPDDVCQALASACGVAPEGLTLLAAPTASEAGTVQIVARSVETALHKLFELGFDLGRVQRGHGIAPLPPVADDDLAAIGCTNDAILYGGEVTLWVHGDDESLQELGPRVPSSASGDFGEPFAAIFKRYKHDFYAVDPHLFSPALIRLVNLDTNATHEFGHLAPEVVRRSFGAGD